MFSWAPGSVHPIYRQWVSGDGACAQMLDTVNSVVGTLASFVDYASHIILLIFRNILFFGFLAAVVWGFYRLILRAIRYLRGMRGEELEHGRRSPDGKSEDSSA